MATRPRSLQPSPLRQAFAVLAAAGVAAFAALVVGEYDFSGTTPYVAGALFGLVVAEVMLTVARVGRPALAGAAAILAGLGMFWAASISAGVGPVAHAGYAGMILAMVVAGAWVSAPTRRRRAEPPPDATETHV